METRVNPLPVAGESLAGLTAIVTGAGSGIGQAAARALSAAGAQVIVTELPDRLERADATASEIESTGGHAQPLTLDVRSRESIADCVGATMRGRGRLDILVNNAGVNVRQPAFDVTEEAWDLVLDTNLKGLFFMAQAAGRVMRDQIPPGGQHHQRRLDHGSRRLPRSRRLLLVKGRGRQPLPRAGLRVGAVSDSRQFRLPDVRRNPTDPGDVPERDHQERHPGTHTGWQTATPEEVAAAIAFLAGPSARMITGSALTIDGGWTAV